MTVMQEQKWRKVLVETALLGQGLPSLTNENILRDWRHEASVSLVWLEKGRITTGNIKDFLQLRGNPSMERNGAGGLMAAMRGGASGYLTSSAVMRFAAQTDHPVVVTAGMGGIRGRIISDDLTTLRQFSVVLVASAPKDTLDLSASIDYLRRHGVRLLGHGTNQSNGFLFIKEAVALDGVYSGQKAEELIKNGPSLIFNPLPPSLRFTDLKILVDALVQGEVAEGHGRQFHPAVNLALDRLTDGRASIMQLHSLVDNIDLALSLL